MKRFTKAVSLLLCIMLLAVSFTAYAVEPEPVFTVKQMSSAYPGEEFTVSVNMNANRGFCAGEFKLGYDSSVITPVKVSGGDVAGKYFVANKSYSVSEVYFAIMDTDLIKASGEIAEVTFRVADSVVLYDGDLDLDVSSLVGDIPVGYGLNSVDFTAVDSSFFVARRIIVPTADNPTVMEDLLLKGPRAEMVLCGTDCLNLIPSKIAENFTDGTVAKFFARDNTTELAASQMLTTGCKIKLFDNNVLTDTLTISVKGDINGDYQKDAFDAFLAGLVEGDLLNSENADAAEIDAADTDGDGIVSDGDFSSLEANGLNF